jgi:hypothetical protein
MMIEEGLFQCDESEEDDDGICISQQTKLNLLFTISTSTFMVSSLFIGIFVDSYGPTKAVILVSLSLLKFSFSFLS